MVSGKSQTVFCLFSTFVCFQWLCQGISDGSIQTSIHVELTAVNGQLKCMLNQANEIGTIVKFRWNIEGFDKSYLDNLTFISNPDYPITVNELSIQTIKKNFLFRNINCFVSLADVSTNENPKWGHEIASNKILPNIECPNSPITMVESSDTQRIELRVKKDLGTKTVCKNCTVLVTVTFDQIDPLLCSPTEAMPQVVVLGNCSQTHSLADIMNVAGFSIMATIENIYDPSSKVRMNIRVANTEDKRLHKLCPVDITINDYKSNEFCTAWNDPHISPFDKPCYDFMKKGVFRIYKRKNEPFEVYTKAVQCTEYHPNTCNLQVAIISEDDVIFFRKDLAVVVYSRDHHIVSRIRRNGKERSYQVIFPSGTSVYIEPTYLDMLQVIIQRSNYDVKNTTGLCDDNDKTEMSYLWSKNGAHYNITTKFPQQITECACLNGSDPICKPGLHAYRCKGVDENPDDITNILIKAAITTPFKWSKNIS